MVQKKLHFIKFAPVIWFDSEYSYPISVWFERNQGFPLDAQSGEYHGQERQTPPGQITGNLFKRLFRPPNQQNVNFVLSDGV